MMPREVKFFKQDTLIQSVLYSLCKERVAAFSTFSWVQMYKDWYSLLKHIQAIIEKNQAYSRALKINNEIQAFSRPTGDPVNSPGPDSVLDLDM